MVRSEEFPVESLQKGGGLVPPADDHPESQPQRRRGERLRGQRDASRGLRAEDDAAAIEALERFGALYFYRLDL